MFVKHLNERSWRAIKSTNIAGAPSLSPSGEWLVYFDGATQSWMRSPFSGSGSEVLKRGRGGGYSPWLVGLEAFEGENGELTSPWPSEGASGPTDCRDIPGICTYGGWHAPISDTSGVLCRHSGAKRDLWLSTRGSEPTLLVPDACHPRIVEDRLIFLRRGELWAAKILQDGALAGEVVPTGIGVYQSARGSPGHFDIAKNGTLFYLDSIPQSELWRLDRDGNRLSRIPLDQPLQGGAPVLVEVSPSGGRALVTAGNELRVVSLTTGGASRSIATDWGAWLDDSTFAVFRNGDHHLELRDIQTRLLKTVDFEATAWSIDAIDPVSRTALVSAAAPNSSVDSDRSNGLLLVDLDGEEPSRMWFDGLGLDRYPDISPDRSLIAWEALLPSHEVQLSPWGHEADPIPVSTNGGVNPKFAKDSRALYFTDSARAVLMVVDILPEQSPPFSPARPLFRLPKGTILTQDVAYDTLPGGEFLIAIAEREMRHRLVINWLDEVDALLGEAVSEP